MRSISVTKSKEVVLLQAKIVILLEIDNLVRKFDQIGMVPTVTKLQLINI